MAMGLGSRNEKNGNTSRHSNSSSKCFLGISNLHLNSNVDSRFLGKRTVANFHKYEVVGNYFERMEFTGIN